LQDVATLDNALDQVTEWLDLHAIAIFPLRAGGEFLGFIGADPKRRQHPFTERDLTLLTGIARQTATALSAAYARRRAEGRATISRP